MLAAMQGEAWAFAAAWSENLGVGLSLASTTVLAPETQAIFDSEFSRIFTAALDFHRQRFNWWRCLHG